MMKWLKYTGLYFMIMSVGYTMLKFMDANDVWLGLFMIGNGLCYFAKLWEKNT